MQQESQKDIRLSKRAWLLENFDYILKQAVYYRSHKELFAYHPLKVWKWGKEQGSAKINYVEQE